ncbi:CDP-diacylglycerol--serine O-phosphatidyltransferase [Persicobacter psychrovividus]|uniref:CDP-diacylglycerol--serine O-phosphatidyltransferase n=1 Tax=Persicobacter psychrovividus TaxID=387638 RepID=A0ABM7VGQ2_9BACT|nr:CDP-diacylglycerol--serine O-phosphatidyltransferase [Persicobacter psychrovividus]
MKIFNIPNTLTCGNLTSGCVGIVMAFHGNLLWAAALIWIGAIFDFFDGFSARLLKQFSPIGGDLDSLADMVTFGVLPSVIYFQLLSNIEHLPSYLPYLAFIMAAFSALRLAKFNVDDRQTTSFVGLPTPANAIFVSALPFILSDNILNAQNWLLNPYLLLILVVIFSFLLIAEIPMFALKFKTYGWKGNEIIYSFLLISAIAIVALKVASIPFIILLYILISVIRAVGKPKQA